MAKIIKNSNLSENHKGHFRAKDISVDHTRKKRICYVVAVLIGFFIVPKQAPVHSEVCVETCPQEQQALA